MPDVRSDRFSVVTLRSERDPVAERAPARVREIVVSAVTPHGAEVILFGSWARGDRHRASDIDLAVRALRPFPRACWPGSAKRWRRAPSPTGSTWPRRTTCSAPASNLRGSDGPPERALGMADDRNLTVHSDNKPLAEATYARLAGHRVVLEAWLVPMRGIW